MKSMLLATVFVLGMGGIAAAANPVPPSNNNADMRMPPPHGMMMEDMDANHDGAVTKDEFRAFHDKRFDEMDRNHDGKLSNDEMMPPRGMAPPPPTDAPMRDSGGPGGPGMMGGPNGQLAPPPVSNTK